MPKSGTARRPADEGTHACYVYGIVRGKTRLPKDYLNPAKNFQAGEKALGNDEMPFEFLMNALRLTKGVESRLYPERTGMTLESLAEGRREAEQSGLLQVEPSRLVATERGQLFLNDLLQKFLT